MYRGQVNKRGAVCSPPERYARSRGRFVLLCSCALLFLAAAFAPLSAEVGRNGAIFLREGFDPRAKALGEAYVGITDDAYSMFYNAAGLSLIDKNQLTTSYLQGLADSNSQFVGYARPVGANRAVGIGLARFTAGTIDIYSPSAPVESRNAEEDLLLCLGYAVSGSSTGRGQWHVGAGMKLYNSTLAQEALGRGGALDFGALWTHPHDSLGVSFSNLGPGIGYKGGIATGHKDPLPATLRFGGSVLLPVALPSSRWLVSAEVRSVFLERTTFAVGTEFLYHDLAALRLGYGTGQNLGALSMGLGLKWEGFRLDYSLGLMQAINNQQSVSLTHSFGPARAAAKIP